MPRTTFAPATRRAFGIELEVIRPAGVGYAEIAAAITAAGVTCRVEGYNHDTRNHWKVVSDASLGQMGAEVVSPKLSGEAGIAEARLVAETLTRIGCTVSTQCGFHIHVDAADLTVETMKKVAINFLLFETFFDHIMPASRRGSHNTYVKSNRSIFGGYGTEAVKAGVAAIRNATTILDLIRVACRNDRYWKLNLTPYLRQRSIEFRQHSGTTDADKVEHWVRLMTAFVEKCTVARTRDRMVSRDKTPAEEMHHFFVSFPATEETRRFYMRRRVEIRKADNRRRGRVA